MLGRAEKLKTMRWYEKNFRLWDKNHAPFKLNGQSRTAFGLLKAPELQRLSVTVEVLTVGVMIVGVINVGVMTVGVLSVGVMTLSHFNLSFSFHFIPIWVFFLLKCLLICYVYIINMIYYFVHEKKNLLLIILHNQCK
jgi:hypothetical protein